MLEVFLVPSNFFELCVCDVRVCRVCVCEEGGWKTVCVHTHIKKKRGRSDSNLNRVSVDATHSHSNVSFCAVLMMI